MNSDTASTIIERIRAGDRVSLARALTLLESSRAQDRNVAAQLVDHALAFSTNSQRIGISGTPGVGKSTFIERFGTALLKRGHKLAVLAVDPSSKRNGGSILGDKTRMAGLAVDQNAFIRPSPSGGSLGGVADMTRESIIVLEAAGFDVILVETVGVGQSETMVGDMVDFFLVLMQPGAGDELQGIKKGIIELADMIAVNKADGALKPMAQSIARQYRNALSLLEPLDPGWQPPVVCVSSVEGDGVLDVWDQIQKHRSIRQKNGAFERKRAEQRLIGFETALNRAILAQFHNNHQTQSQIAVHRDRILAGKEGTSHAVRQILEAATGRD